MRTEAEAWAARWGVPLALALLAIAARALLSTERATWLGITRTVVVGLFVGAVTNLYLADSNLLTDGARGAVVGVAAVLAEDLLMALLRVARRFREEPLLIVNWLLTTFTKAPAIPTTPVSSAKIRQEGSAGFRFTPTIIENTSMVEATRVSRHPLRGVTSRKFMSGAGCVNGIDPGNSA